jgi:hypothetical protein
MMTLFEQEFIAQADAANAGQGYFEFAAGGWIYEG